MPDAIIGPDDLSGWEAAPPAARARRAPELIRRFDTAEAALAFLARHVAERSHKAPPPRPARTLAADAGDGVLSAQRSRFAPDIVRYRGAPSAP
jgi:hypothetical protein